MVERPVWMISHGMTPVFFFMVFVFTLSKSEPSAWMDVSHSVSVQPGILGPC
jgi:hypothetical protein